MKSKISLAAVLIIISMQLQAQSWVAGTKVLYVNPDSTKVGIGITSPTERLHVNKGALKIGNSTTLSDRTKNVLKFGDGDYVKIGEWEADDMLSFKANKYNFTTGNLGVGTDNPLYKLDVRGTIRANEVLVNNVSGADFVFEDTYQLRPLSEVGVYILTNKHLPEIPSATEMREKGVNMNELQMRLLQKVEELTLYIIQQEKRIQELEALRSK